MGNESKDMPNPDSSTSKSKELTAFGRYVAASYTGGFLPVDRSASIFTPQELKKVIVPY